MSEETRAADAPLVSVVIPCLNEAESVAQCVEKALRGIEACGLPGEVVVVDLVDHLQRSPLPENMILNVNVPDLPFNQLRGIKATRLGHRHKAESARAEALANGEHLYWVGAAGAARDVAADTDFGSVADGYVSITPLSIDLTHRPHINLLDTWVAPLNQRG